MERFEFKLPDIGEGIVEGEIVKWLVKEGDVVGEDQPMVEVMTDKATVTIPSPRRGRVVKLFGNVGEIAKVHAPLVVLEVDAPAELTTGQVDAPVSDESPLSTSMETGLSTPRREDMMNGRLAGPDRVGGNGSRVLATPVTRRIAREHGILLEQVRGTGPGGRVLKEDVLRAVAVEPLPRVAPPSQGDERIPMRGLRKRIAQKMVQSKFTAPHFTFVEEVDATQLKALRERLNSDLEASGEKLRVSFLPFVCKALVNAMQRFPTLNANFDEAAQELVVRRVYNFGIAVATEEGLLVPVVKKVERKNLRQLAEEISTLARSARERKLKPEDLAGGTFTITSLGQQGGLFATPIINHPEVAILGVHKMRPRPVVVDGQIAVRDMMYLSLSFDHRSIDGAVGAAFTYELMRYLERPELLMLEMT